MWDIKLIRNQPEILDQSLEKRGLKAMSDEILNLDQQLRVLQRDGDILRASLKASSKVYANQKPTEEQIAANKELGLQIKQNEENYIAIESNLKNILLSLPNLVSDQTPAGLTEDCNVVIKTYDHPNKKLTGKKHEEVGNALKQLDKAAGANIAGSRFVVFKDKIAKLARMLSYWLIEENTKAGYTEMQVPFMMNEEIAYGMGVLPKFAEDLFKVDTGHYLIPTGEASLVGMHYKQTLDIAPNKPLLMTTCTPCFRSEAGSAGKDTTGIIRLHQFQKIEIAGFVHPDDIEYEHNRLVEHVEHLLVSLGLSYRVLAMCAGDLGFHAHKKFDIEVWMPGLGRYVEISSCSQCNDFQARRLHIKTADKSLPHTLNGSALPIERTLAAILENYQTEEGLLDESIFERLKI